MIKKQTLTILVLHLLFSNVFAQISENDLKKLSNSQLNELKKTILSSQDDRVTSSEEILNKAEDITSSMISIEASSDKVKMEYPYFGYEYFKNDINFFDNIPTPSDFRLGPGDEIILSLWGETNLRESFTINKDGMIYYNNIGFINLSNKKLKEAELLLQKELSNIYSTLKNSNNSTKLMLELGKLKAINVYFSGNVENPGIHLVHPFSDIFSALVQVGGVNQNGTLRELQLIRNNTIVSKIDFYSFFMDGKNQFSNIKLIDGDVIHIPNVETRVSISGQVNRPSTYELLPGESISDIITYASGFKSDASSSLILSQITPVEQRSSDDNARTKIAINFKNKESIMLNNGDSINVPSISPVDLNINIYGRVKSPGSYPGANTTLKSVLDIAGGFDDPQFKKTIREDIITILRQDENQFYSKEIVVDYKNADQFKLEINDKILVYEDINYKNNFTYRVEGEVNKPGTYPISEATLTVGEALSLAGGLTELSSERNLIVKQELTEVNEAGNEITTLEIVNNVTQDFEIGINSVIIASPAENIVRVQGNVYNPGLVTFTKGYRYPKYIELAGGYRSNTLKNKAYIKRANGRIEKVNGFFISRGKKIYPGDIIVVPANPDPKDFDITSFLSDISITLANLAAILLIVDNQNN